MFKMIFMKRYNSNHLGRLLIVAMALMNRHSCEEYPDAYESTGKSLRYHVRRRLLNLRIH